MPKKISANEIQLALSFRASFPYPAGQADIIVPNVDFDTWADNHRYYSKADQKATVSANRNNLRNKINHVGSHKEFLVAGHEPFHVAVHSRGISVIVSPPPDAFDLKVDKAPGQVTAKAEARVRDLEKLKEIIVSDQNSPPEALLRVTYAIKEIEKYKRVIEFQQAETDAAIKSSYEEIRKLAQTGALGLGASSGSKLLTNGNNNTP